MTGFLSRGAEIAVVGAAGKTGAAVVAALEGLADVRRVVHTARRPGDVAVDLDTGAGLVEALSGCRGVYVIAPNVHPDEPAIVRRVLAAAADTGVEHVVYHSVAWPYTPAMPHHVDKAVCEDLLRTSGLRWTVLQPCAYVENFGAVLDGSASTVELPYSPDATFSFVRLADVAEVAARVLVEGPDIHHGATYELGGPEPLSVRDLCDRASVPVSVKQVPVTEWMSRHSRDLTADGRARLSAMFEFYDRHGFVAGNAVFESLLGRPPT
ncbi:MULTISPECIES: NmrA family NAD(P)-binding protein [unclassified Rhodococcus (in: high G+C Gram-positive bacteria)]|uniref:NmrA family NAD(P)-binding protein n=1 Tax=unclassified Rhodococcus (in: high G+C Gram-positive bacteria) TaxID=192944 RepID=UPI001639743B|nr:MULTISPECIES: NmrA family NAD(P)-binding protein [unclassified Rhodococcus (in: high G+C Gram-positive bacteria)]MBC2640934.1 NmrA family NAD(P)-binding protein [Rhodococcus sp. 3A]MBC2894323.1 NmrA family NAD(P)-binding protein [Rhodococcus sp. 4CII]